MEATIEAAGRSDGAVAYSAEQDRTWAYIRARLAALHAQHACASYLRGVDALAMPHDRIPQLHDLSAALDHLCGYTIEPIGGLIDARPFLISLGRGIMPSTTYIRDGANPEYTPAPDIVHEVLGHVPMLIDADLRALLALFGDAATQASDTQMIILERLYWFTVEYGMVEENGASKAWGAGLLSSFGELDNAFGGAAALRPFDAARAAETGYDHTHMQPILFVTPSLQRLHGDVSDFLRNDHYRRG